MFLLVILVTLLSFSLETQAVGYKLNHEKIVLLYCNKDYFGDPSLALFQFNETSKAYNMSGMLKRDMPEDFKVGVQALKFQRGEYRSFPSRIAPIYCEMVARNDFGIRTMFTNGNLTNCPIKKGYYYVTNFMIDDNQVPPQFLIPGRYKINGKLFNKSTTFSRFEWYMGVVPR